MKCTCPKCRANIEIELPPIVEESTQASCPSCNARFTVSRESFGARAFRKSGEISCANCGELLGPHLHCPSCGAIYPDYMVVGTGRKKARRPMAKLQLKSSPFPRRQTQKIELPGLDAAAKTAVKGKERAGKKRTKVLPIAVAALLFVAVSAGGAVYYQQYKAGKEFVRNVVLAVYGIEVGQDRGLEVCAKIAADWKAKTDAGQTVVPRPTMADLNELNVVKAKLDTYMQKVAAAQEKQKPTADKVVKLYAVYAKTYTLACAPAGTVASYNDAASKQDNDFKAAAHEFKSGLSPEQMTALRNGAKRLREVQVFLDR